MTKNLKIIFISDTHNKLSLIKDKVPSGDVLVHCGDFGGSGSMKEYLQFIREFDELFDHPHKLFTFGNHDGWGERQLKTAIDMAKERGITCLVEEEIVIDGIKFYFSPYTPRYGRWYWMKDRNSDSLKRVWNNIPYDTNILVTHGGPYGILDRSPYDDIHCGCELLKLRIEELPQLKAHAFGHIHNESGVYIDENGLTYINAAICDEQYLPTNPPRVFNITPNEV